MCMLLMSSLTILSYRDRIASDGRMTDEWSIEEDLEEMGRSVNGVLSRNLPGGTEKNRENSQGSRCHVRDSNRPPLGYKYTASSLEAPVWWYMFMLIM
jgi:hypothetical protein